MIVMEWAMYFHQKKNYRAPIKAAPWYFLAIFSQNLFVILVSLDNKSCENVLYIPDIDYTLGRD